MGISETQRAHVQEHVALNVRRLSDDIQTMSPSIDDKLNRLKVPDEMKEHVLKVLSSLSDDRLKSLMEEMAVALHQAMNATMDHSEFKQLTTERFAERKKELL